MSDHFLLEHRLIDEKDIGPAIFRLYENRIYHVIVKKGEKATMEVVREGYLFLDSNGGGKYYNIYQFESFSDVDPDVRDWSASPTNNSYTHIDAIVFSSFPQKIIADFYVAINRPVKPTRSFKSLESAYKWVMEMIEKEPI